MGNILSVGNSRLEVPREEGAAVEAVAVEAAFAAVTAAAFEVVLAVEAVEAAPARNGGPDPDPDGDGDGDPPPDPPRIEATAAAAVASRQNDSSNSAVRWDASGFREAVRLLLREDRDDRRPVERLAVTELERRRGDAPSAFSRFVELLGQLDGGGRTIRGISFHVKWRGLPEGEMERLFRTVLPGHRTIKQVTLSLHRLPPRFVRMLTENVATANNESSLSSLRMGSGASDPAIQDQVVRAVVDMLDRNAAIRSLHMDLRLDTDQCRLLCQALPRNTNLRELYLSVTKVRADTLDGVGSSSLRRLEVVAGSFSDDAVPSFARQLRTNETLRNLWLQGSRVDHHRDFREVLDLVKTYNCTIRTLDGDVLYPVGSYDGNVPVRERARGYLRRNGRIRIALGKLKKPGPDDDRGMPTQLLPQLLGLVSDQPTVLYRVLRTGYGNAMSDTILVARENDEGGTVVVAHAIDV